MVSSSEETSRFVVKASQMMNKNIMTATREISDPIEEIVFHRV